MTPAGGHEHFETSFLRMQLAPIEAWIAAQQNWRCPGAGKRAQYQAAAYLAQMTDISTSMRGSASLASTVARAGRLSGSTQASQTLFMCSRLRISDTQILAERILDLSVPARARTSSMAF